MKYKRLLIFVTVLLFVTVIIICSMFAFSVAKIDASVVTINNSSENVKELVTKKAETYKKRNLLFLKDSQIKSEIEETSPYVKVKEIKKEYPNKLTVYAEERTECFALKVNEEYFVLDKEFFVIKSIPNNKNNIDGQPNILLDISLADYSFNSLKAKTTFNFLDDTTNDYFKTNIDFYHSQRNLIESVKVIVKEQGVYNRSVVIKMKTGVTYVLESVNNNYSLKLNAIINHYNDLDNKSVGKYYINYNNKIIITP